MILWCATNSVPTMTEISYSLPSTVELNLVFDLVSPELGTEWDAVAVLSSPPNIVNGSVDGNINHDCLEK